MLNLKLRDEFLGSQMPGTAIALRRPDNTGAAQRDPDYILSITYPTADVQTALRAVSTNRFRLPVVLIGDRGRGKSHIMAVMHHAIQSPDRVEVWAKEWGSKLGSDLLSGLTLERGFVAISEPVHNHEYPLLWELLFDRHPRGEFYRGKFQQMRQPYPPRSLLEEMLEDQPVALILDEFQKWFDGLRDEPGVEGIKYRTWAENFIQNLSELSKDRPDILIFVISVLNNNTEAYRQVHRDGPVLIDFRGPTAKQDRQKLLLYRLFENRENIPDADIQSLVSAYAGERFRLRFSHLSDAERNRIVSEVVGCWPFSPELLELLEDQILMAEAAQETRDLIRILASVFRARGDDVPVITPADFFVDDDACGVQSLLDSIATVGEQEKLREVAQRNLETIRAVGADIPHARELVSALWMRSMSPVPNAGATRQELQLDITRDKPVDDNFFRRELTSLIENSINIHGEERPDGRLHFGLEENPRSRVRTCAKNDKLWQPGATSSTVGQTVYPGKDIEHIRNTLRHILVPETRQPASRVIVLGPNWRDDPWSDVDDVDKPRQWGCPVLIVVPDPLKINGGARIPDLGKWLKEHVSEKRNTVRFLLLTGGAKEGIYADKNLLFSARCSYLTSIAWRDDLKYRALKDDFDKPLRASLKKIYDRFAVLRRWDYRNPELCTFDVERIDAQGGEIPSAVEEKLLNDLFDPAEFERVVLEYAENNETVGRLLDDLQEPPSSPQEDAIPFLGETAIYEEILKIVAKGNVVVNVGGTWVGRLPDHTSYEEALRYVRSKAFRSGQEMRQAQLGLPTVVGGTTVISPRPQSPAPPPLGVASPNPASPTGTEELGSQGYGSVQPPTGAGAATPPTASPVRVRRTDAPSTGINLSGYLEKWGIPASKTLSSAKIEFSNLTVQQLKQVLQRLPIGLRAFLEITFTEKENDA